MKAALLMDPALTPFVFGERAREQLSALVDIDLEGAVTRVDDMRDAADVDVLITGWGVPLLDRASLDRFTRLRAIVHWGGGVTFLDRSVQDRGIVVSSARSANAIPVAEFTLAMVVLAAKDAFWASRLYCEEQRHIDRESRLGHTGLVGDAVGVIGASTIGELVINGLRQRGIITLLYDPTWTKVRAEVIGVEWCESLQDLASRSRIVTVHAPDIPQTRGMISADVLAAMPDRSTIINTARGAIIDQDALVAELETGRLRAVLDVTEPDVLPPGHPLYSMPNVFLTPHVAGSMGTELLLLGDAAVAELARFMAGERFHHPAPV